MKIQMTKNALSTWVILAFLAVLAVATFISEFFQTPRDANSEVGLYKELFTEQELNSMRSLGLKNHLGGLQLERNLENLDNPWRLTLPRQMPADEKKVEQIFSVLKNIKIRKIYQKDKINMQNFSLDKPFLELSLNDSSGLESMLSLGLVNPIDSSTYATLSTHQAIYHIDALDASLGNLDYSHFIDSKIFTFDPLRITRFKVFRGGKKPHHLALQFQKKGDFWVDKADHVLNRQKVQKFISEVVELRSLFIIDKMDTEMKEKLDGLMERPLMIIEVEEQNNRTYQYVASALINALPGLRLEKWKNFAMTASNRKFPYVLGRDLLKYFSRPEKSFQERPLKKLSYD